VVNLNRRRLVNLSGVCTQNPSLSNCVVKSICDRLATPGCSLTIHYNAAGCNSQAEVEAACKEGLDENQTPESHISIYPNPSSSTITIELPRTNPIKHTFLTIFNITEQQLTQRQIMEQQIVIDLTRLPQGVYLVRVLNDRTLQVRKIIIDR
jgi:hypothetical protein